MIKELASRGQEAQKFTPNKAKKHFIRGAKNATLLVNVLFTIGSIGFKNVENRVPDLIKNPALYSEDSPEYSFVHLGSGATQSFDSNVIAVGDVSVNGKRYYDDNPKTGLIVHLPEGGAITAPYGADVLIPSSESDKSNIEEIINEKKQQLLEYGCENGCSSGVSVKTVTKDSSEPTQPPDTSPQAPKIEKTIVEPRQELNFIVWIPNPYTDPKNRTVGLEFQGGNGGVFKKELRFPVDSEQALSEWSRLVIPAGGAYARVRMSVPPGASATCLDAIFARVISLEEGASSVPLDRPRLTNEVCVPETLEPVVTSYVHDTYGNRVIYRIVLRNNAQYTAQKTSFNAPPDRCSFPSIEQEFRIGEKRIFPHEIHEIDSNGVVEVTVYSTLPDDAVITLPLSCMPPTLNRVVEWEKAGN